MIISGLPYPRTADFVEMCRKESRVLLRSSDLSSAGALCRPCYWRMPGENTHRGGALLEEEAARLRWTSAFKPREGAATITWCRFNKMSLRRVGSLSFRHAPRKERSAINNNETIQNYSWSLVAAVTS